MKNTYLLVGGPYAGRKISSLLPRINMPAPIRAERLHLDGSFPGTSLVGYTLHKARVDWSTGHIEVDVYKYDGIDGPEATRAAIAMFLADIMARGSEAPL